MSSLRLLMLLCSPAVLGCAGPPRPAVMHDMTFLPDDPTKRNDQLDSAQARPGPERGKPLSPTLQKVETGAATAAAIIGTLFSTSRNTLIGVGAPVDENQLFPGGQPKTTKRSPEEEEAEPAGPPEYDANQLTPWIRFGPPPE